jgi:hypothetical protein
VLLCDVRRRRKIDKPEQGVGRRFDPDHLRLVTDRPADVFRFSRVDWRHANAETRQRLPGKLGCSGIVGAADDEVIALAQ